MQEDAGLTKLPGGKLSNLNSCLGFPGGSDGKASAYNAGDLASILGWEDPLEKEKATHSSILAWRIPGTVHGITKSWA